ncbi:MAG TPA: restriction endonuclease subunit S [Rhodocyclaceae bacterium]|nr:restriction endonuclease subunit S [Rhodocyclaceae bacterium]HND81680.1 restriction endonuclease subunit S [Accumulibacter sp.]
MSEHLPLLASAPDGIQKLRGLILELAVRGKLVPQDPDDEPASELLKRIMLERARLEAQGGGKKSKPLFPVAENEQPFDGPDIWEFVRLGSVLEMVNGRAFKPGDWRPAGIPIVRIQNLNNPTAPYNYCDAETLDGRHRLVSGDFLISWSGTPGTSFGAFIWNRGEAALNQHIFRCVQIGAGFTSEFLRLAINSQLNVLIAKAQGGVGLQHVTKGTLEALVLPLPPLAEQHRIVKTVDELMALCDRLEAEQADVASAHTRLVETLLGTLTQSTDVADLAANWQRLAEHFDTLFATEASIDALKQTVLQLAVMGKLVPQDPNDEAASDLLRRMQKGRRLKRKCSVIDIDSLESPLPEIPSGWFWTVVDQVAADHENSIADGPFGANLKTEHYISEVGYRVVRLQNIGYGDFRGEHHAYVTQERYLSLQKHHVYAGDLVVAGLVDDRVRCCELPKTIGHALVKADCYRFSVHPEVCSAYALHYLNSPLSSDFAAAHHHGMTLTRIGLGNFRQIPFPLPPQAEQRRIVAKVDELIVLCDHLKADLTTSRLRQARLTDTLIESALEAA